MERVNILKEIQESYPQKTPSKNTKMRRESAQEKDEREMLNACYAHRSPQELLSYVLKSEKFGRVALVSSFGAESAVLLHMIAQIDPNTEVIFVDTGKLFGETHRYRKDLIALFGLTNVRIETPSNTDIQAKDPKGILWSHDVNTCCYVRRVLPLQRALKGVNTWITGRKRFQAETRSKLSLFERDDKSRLKVNPLASWTPEDLSRYARSHDLPTHPLVPQGFLSIGCMPCTDRVQPGEDARSGRWRGSEKTECGIHLPTHGTESDGSGI